MVYICSRENVPCNIDMLVDKCKKSMNPQLPRRYYTSYEPKISRAHTTASLMAIKLLLQQLKFHEIRQENGAPLMWLTLCIPKPFFYCCLFTTLQWNPQLSLLTKRQQCTDQCATYLVGLTFSIYDALTHV